MSTVIAEREFDLKQGDEEIHGVARIFAPACQTNADGEAWNCEYQIEWPGFQHHHAMIGADSYQALTLALQIVPVIIATSSDLKSGRLSWMQHVVEFDGRQIMTPSLEEAFGLKPLSSGSVQ